MNKKNKFLIILKEISKILSNKEGYKKKYNDIRMMRFKIQPYFGNLELLKINKKEMVNTLWFLGKLEEIVNKYYSNISIEEIQKILDYIKNNVKNTNLEKIEKNNLEKAIEETKVLEMEIFQDSQSKKIVN
jgi:hypothetical protein